MALRVRLTLEPDGATCLESPYERSFVEGLKQALDYGGRAWDATRKRWIVSALYADALVQYLESAGCSIQDDRTPVPTAGAAVPLPAMPTDLREAFDVLYLQYTAPLCVAEGSWRALVKYYHPDVGGDVALFQSVTEAIQVVRHYLDLKDDFDDSSIPF